MEATIETLFSSSFLEIKRFVCNCMECNISDVEYQEAFTISYVSQGTFLFKVFRDDVECFTGRFLINKPGYTHQVQHFRAQPDTCLIFRFTPLVFMQLSEDFALAYKKFLSDPDRHSMALSATPEMEYLLYYLNILLKRPLPDTLQIESLVSQLISDLFSKEITIGQQLLTPRQKAAYLPRIETAKYYLQQHFMDPVGLKDVAASTYISEFHFSRIFRQIACVSPHQYLLRFRLQNAHRLLLDTKESVKTIAFKTGFGSLEHFSYVFKGHYGISPSNLRVKQ